MTLTYRGVKYEQEDRANSYIDWWNLANRPWLRLTYRNFRYNPFLTGGQIKCWFI